MKSLKRVISTIMTLSSPIIIHENVITLHYIALISMLLPLLPSHQRLDEQVDICVHAGHPSSLLQQVFFFVNV